jgi:hypothetical protein
MDISAASLQRPTTRWRLLFTIRKKPSTNRPRRW